jgi:hypothetical protein
VGVLCQAKGPVEDAWNGGPHPGHETRWGPEYYYAGYKKMILLITKDLFFVPTLKSAAQNADAELTTALSPDSTKVSELSEDEVTACVVDLSQVKVDDLAGVFSDLRQKFPT